MIPKVCILLATYNGVKYAGEQINSILNQSGVSVDIYVSDDFSTDGTFELIKEICQNDTRVHVLEREKRYGAAGKNFFSLIERVDLNKYDFVAFSDQDDLWYPDKLELSIKNLIDNKCSGISSCVIAVWANGSKFYVNKARKQKKYDYMFESAGPGCTFLMKIDLVSGFKERLLTHRREFDDVFYHDWAMYAFARSNDFDWYIIPESTMDYRQHLNNDTGVNRGLRAAFVRANKIFDGWYLKQILSVAFAVGFDRKLNNLLYERKPFFIYQLKNILQFRRQSIMSVLVFGYLSFFVRRRV